MKKIILLMFAIVLITGCQNKDVLDTSELEIEESIGNDGEDISVKQLKEMNLPIMYKAPSVEAGLEAIPFEMTLPETLPFETEGFRPPKIVDYTYEGKMIEIEFNATPKQKDKRIFITIKAENFGEYEGHGEGVKINDKVNGAIENNSLTFQTDGILYYISYINKEISEEKHEQELIQLALQMLEKSS
ncbi:hypothetical protein [Pseudalkalibacillus sp. SCS-8]|uniref:hypothetical protein n=1 Tax=Pseudalkalibacillus nanhaiensis TaxID=3115291 RepID=UPI0032DB5CA4